MLVKLSHLVPEIFPILLFFVAEKLNQVPGKKKVTNSARQP